MAETVATNAPECVTKAALLIGRLVELQTAGKPPKSIVVLPLGDQQVDQVKPDGAAYTLRVNPSVLSAKRMEAARQLVARDVKLVQPYFDYNHEDKEASGYPKRFWWKDGVGVMADVEWTPSAVAKITGATPEFQAFSPRIPIDEQTGEALGLFLNTGGLVNRPLFGARTKLFPRAADEQELVAADPDAVELVSALPEAAAAAGPLVAHLCAAFGRDTGTATEAELIAEFDKQRGRVAALEARAGLVGPVIAGLGFGGETAPRAEELAGRIAELGRPGDAVIGRELAGFAVGCGILAPAEREEWERRLAKDRAGWTRELLARSPAVLLGKFVREQTAGGRTPNDWKRRARELIARDPDLKRLAESSPDAAMSRAIERMNAGGAQQT